MKESKYEPVDKRSVYSRLNMVSFINPRISTPRENVEGTAMKANTGRKMRAK